MIACDSSRGNTTLILFGSTGGIIIRDDHGHNSLEPYNIIGQQPRRDRGDSFSSRPIEPLRPLDRLDTLDSFSRSHRDDDVLLPLLLGE